MYPPCKGTCALAQDPDKQNVQSCCGTSKRICVVATGTTMMRTSDWSRERNLGNWMLLTARKGVTQPMMMITRLCSTLRRYYASVNWGLIVFMIEAAIVLDIMSDTPHSSLVQGTKKRPRLMANMSPGVSYKDISRSHMIRTSIHLSGFGAVTPRRVGNDGRWLGCAHRSQRFDVIDIAVVGKSVVILGAAVEQNIQCMTPISTMLN